MSQVLTKVGKEVHRMSTEYRSYLCVTSMWMPFLKVTGEFPCVEMLSKNTTKLRNYKKLFINDVIKLSTAVRFEITLTSSTRRVSQVSGGVW